MLIRYVRLFHIFLLLLFLIFRFIVLFCLETGSRLDENMGGSEAEVAEKAVSDLKELHIEKQETQVSIYADPMLIIVPLIQLVGFLRIYFIGVMC